MLLFFFLLSDVDECKRFQPEVCKNGVCVNNIPGYSCYCTSGYVYNSTLLECVGAYADFMHILWIRSATFMNELKQVCFNQNM